MRGSLLHFVILGILFFAVSCRGGQEVDPEILNLLGPYTATGTVTSTGTSLYRRGTHVLLMEGRSRFFLESRSVDLNAYEGDYVVLRGELAANTHPSFLPVLQVVSVEKLKEPVESSLQTYDVPSLRVSLEAPTRWVSTLEGEMLSFHLQEEESAFVRIEQSSEPLPEGLSIRIDGKNGVRVIDHEGNRHRVFVANLLFAFVPQGETSQGERDAFYTMLRSVQFAEDAEDSEDSEETGGQQIGTGALIPCGGSAGVLCPEGMYCEVREMDTGIGVCRRVE